MNAAAPRAGEVFREALRLGLTSFGGPIAHLGYFERTYVRKLRWIGSADYASLLALCQVLPGPASSQLGFLIGLRRAGWSGGIAAWIGFTLPSALLMYAFAAFAPNLSTPLAGAALHGLELAAVAVVAQAVLSMARRLCTDRNRVLIAAVAAALVFATGSAVVQFAALALGALAGLLLCRDARWPAGTASEPVGRGAARAALALAFGLLALLPLVAAIAGPRSALAFVDAFYRAGALVFGGGHVVLPLLHDALVPQWLAEDAFLAGYGGAQALPGPLFAVAAYYGAVAAPPLGGAVGACVALVALFLPGLLLACAGARLFAVLGRWPAAAASLAGVNAAVVGVLAAAWVDPVCTGSLRDLADAAVGLLGWLLLERGGWPPVLVVGLCVAVAMLREAM